MKNKPVQNEVDHKQRLTKAYHSERPKLMSKLRSLGKTLEEAEDLVQDVYAETWERLPFVMNILNLPAWIRSLFNRRVIDAWRHNQVQAAVGEVDVGEETIREIISAVGLNPLDNFVRENMIGAMNDALRALPVDQRKVIEAQVFGGMTFREISEATGESIDTLTARKRYGLVKLAKALKEWIEE